MIFVQIAAYRDPELLPTIVDCLAKAKHPRDLRFGICWQKHPDDTVLNALKGRRQFVIDEVLWIESQGLGWARSRIQNLYQGEEFAIQIDSHHRFAQNWDATLIEMLESTGSSKPMVGSYACGYDPQTNKKLGVAPHKMTAECFTKDGMILFRPKEIQGWQELQRPVKARFVSGHFFFTLGKHCEDYRHDPNLYFAGNEISLSIRSFTLGYDLFHPHRCVLWHEYTRKGKVKHWNDHSKKNGDFIKSLWHERDAVSKRRLRKLLREDDNDEDLTEFGLGQTRSHLEYEKYAGIDFGRRRLHRETLDGIDPPCSFIDEETWRKALGGTESMILQ